jgi:cytidylate kinase
MIIWINGAFGSGKTQTAFEINRRLENSFVYDPEHIGFFLRRNMPKEIIQGDFQDQALWRTFNYEMIKHIYAKYSGDIIIPMTIYNKNYFEEIIGRLAGDGIKIYHYILGADKETILKRLSKRLDGKNSWAAKKIDVCINGFRELADKSIYIDTNELCVYETADIIAEKSNITLRADKGLEIIKRTMVQIKHIRLWG